MREFVSRLCRSSDSRWVYNVPGVAPRPFEVMAEGELFIVVGTEPVGDCGDRWLHILWSERLCWIWFSVSDDGLIEVLA